MAEAAKRFNLTEKQTEVCVLIGFGATYKAAADTLKISRIAIYWRVRSVLYKSKSATLAEFFFRAGLS
jgi:DNA-binding CsgD family transcriptional regulator